MHGQHVVVSTSSYLSQPLYSSDPVIESTLTHQQFLSTAVRPPGLPSTNTDIDNNISSILSNLTQFITPSGGSGGNAMVPYSNYNQSPFSYEQLKPSAITAGQHNSQMLQPVGFFGPTNPFVALPSEHHPFSSIQSSSHAFQQNGNLSSYNVPSSVSNSQYVTLNTLLASSSTSHEPSNRPLFFPSGHFQVGHDVPLPAAPLPQSQHQNNSEAVSEIAKCSSVEESEDISSASTYRIPTLDQVKAHEDTFLQTKSHMLSRVRSYLSPANPMGGLMVPTSNEVLQFPPNRRKRLSLDEGCPRPNSQSDEGIGLLQSSLDCPTLNSQAAHSPLLQQSSGKLRKRTNAVVSQKTYARKGSDPACCSSEPMDTTEVIIPRNSLVAEMNSSRDLGVGRYRFSAVNMSTFAHQQFPSASSNTTTVHNAGGSNSQLILTQVDNSSSVMMQSTGVDSSASDDESVALGGGDVSSKMDNDKDDTWPSLSTQFPSEFDGLALRILTQPERQHRARYMTEGSRGAIKDQSGQGFPMLKVFGWNRSGVLQIFVASEAGRVKPHRVYQACKVASRLGLDIVEKRVQSTNVIEVTFDAAQQASISVDCVGILKLRNADVEQRNGGKVKEKTTKARLAFRVKLQKVASDVGDTGPDATDNFIYLQCVSDTILCTQPVGTPDICRMSLEECSCRGGVDLFLIGRNFTRYVKVLFRQYGEDHVTIVWEAEAPVEMEYLHQTHLICKVPPYASQDITTAVCVCVQAICGERSTEPQTFWYQPVTPAVTPPTGAQESNLDTLRRITKESPSVQSEAVSIQSPAWPLAVRQLTSFAVPSELTSENPIFFPSSTENLVQQKHEEELCDCGAVVQQQKSMPTSSNKKLICGNKINHAALDNIAGTHESDCCVCCYPTNLAEVPNANITRPSPSTLLSEMNSSLCLLDSLINFDSSSSATSKGDPNTNVSSNPLVWDFVKSSAEGSDNLETSSTATVTSKSANFSLRMKNLTTSISPEEEAEAILAIDSVLKQVNSGDTEPAGATNISGPLEIKHSSVDPNEASRDMIIN